MSRVVTTTVVPIVSNLHQHQHREPRLPWLQWSGNHDCLDYNDQGTTIALITMIREPRLPWLPWSGNRDCLDYHDQGTTIALITMIREPRSIACRTHSCVVVNDRVFTYRSRTAIPSARCMNLIWICIVCGVGWSGVGACVCGGGGGARDNK